RVTLANTQPIAPITFGNTLKYIKISNNGTTSKIGNSALTAISIAPGSIQLAKAKPVPAWAESITQEIPFAKLCTTVFPHVNDMKNHAKNKFKATNIPIDCHWIFFLSLENNIAIPKNTNNPIMLITKNIIH